MLRARLALAFVLLFGGLGIGASCRNSNTNPPPSVNSGGGRSEGQGDPPPVAAGDTITQVQGVDVAALSSSERETFWAVANDELSPCGDPHSLALCGRDRLPCRSCLPALNFLARRVTDGFPREQLSELLRARYGASTSVRINTEGAPSHGSAMASVTIVEFSDYECPHCARAIPVLRQVEREFEGRVRVVHMNFPLTGHTHALAAARAALAAGRQNKFWEMNDLLFENQRSLEASDLERYATQLHLDLARFRADLASPEIEQQIQATRREGERLQITGTPTIFINGRRYDLPTEREPLRQWVQEELEAH